MEIQRDRFGAVPPDDKEICLRLRAIVKSQSKTVLEIAVECETSYPHLSRIIRGERKLSHNLKSRLESVLNVTL